MADVPQVVDAQRDWIMQIVDACADLGLAIRSLGPAEITFYRIGDYETEVTIRSRFLTGDNLRRWVPPSTDK